VLTTFAPYQRSKASWLTLGTVEALQGPGGCGVTLAPVVPVEVD
jgi:hypothetical protein